IKPAKLQSIDQVLHVDRQVRVLRRMDLNVPAIIDREVALAPPRHFIQLAGVRHRPAIHSVFQHLTSPACMDATSASLRWSVKTHHYTSSVATTRDKWR